MRTVLLVSAFCIAAIAANTRAEAESYPWCAQYSKDDGTPHCGFVSFAQCMEDVRGVGGFCIQNNTYQPSSQIRRAGRSSR
jgi:Protein of unknown function (DUF3551)